jgi:predicted acylesterase/phospholipase RssA
MSLIKTVLLGLIIAFASAGTDGKCRALVLSGGGDKGAYQATALTTLMESLPQIETTYDTIVGISAGNLNAALLASFKVDE